MNQLVIATGNQGKFAEIHHAFKDLPFELLPQSNLDVPDIVEHGHTFIENALHKARYVSAVAKLPTLADDSGLVVEALDGQPGIYSARYAGEHATDQQNMAKLLEELEGLPPEQRKAYFYCALVLLKHPADPAPLICTAKWEGMILTYPVGDSGFGYDPIFYVPELKATAAQLKLAKKNELSHRGCALKILIQHLNEKADGCI